MLKTKSERHRLALELKRRNKSGNKEFAMTVEEDESHVIVYPNDGLVGNCFLQKILFFAEYNNLCLFVIAGANNKLKVCMY